VTDTERLRRAYGRLMWAYPRWYRRERGAELVTTLLDDAPPGQRRPTRTDVVDLLRGGLRTRLRLPRGTGGYFAAVITALWLGLAGAAGGVLLSPYPGPPSDAEAVSAAAIAVPQQPNNVPGPVVHCDIICPDWDGTDDVVAFDAPPDRTDRAVVYYHRFSESATATVAAARERLAAAGWDVDPLYVQSDGISSFDASSGGLRLGIVAWPTSETGESVTIVVSKGFSFVAAVRSVGGFLCGLVTGWLAAAWVLQRRRRHRLAIRAATTAAALPFLVVAGAMVGSTGLFTVAIGIDGYGPNDIQTPQFVLWLLPTLFPGFAVTVAVLALVGVGVAALPHRTGQPPARHPVGETG